MAWYISLKKNEKEKNLITHVSDHFWLMQRLVKIIEDQESKKYCLKKKKLVCLFSRGEEIGYIVSIKSDREGNVHFHCSKGGQDSYISLDRKNFSEGKTLNGCSFKDEKFKLSYESEDEHYFEKPRKNIEYFRFSFKKTQNN